MTNAELIAGLRECATVGDCRKCKMHDEYSYDMCAIKLLLAAADAIQTLCDELATYHAKSVTDEKRIENLQKQVNEFIENETHSSVIKAMSRRISDLEKQEPTEKQVEEEIIVDLRCAENKQVVAYEYLAGTRVDFTMEDLTDQGRQILLGLKDER